MPSKPTTLHDMTAQQLLRRTRRSIRAAHAALTVLLDRDPAATYAVHLADIADACTNYDGDLSAILDPHSNPHTFSW